MKKFTVKEFAAKLRESHPGKLDDVDDVTLTYRWTKKYPITLKLLDKVDAAKVGIKWGSDNVVNWFKGKTEKLKQKISPKPTDTTKTQQDTTNDNSVVNTVKDVVDKFKNTNTSPKPTQTIDPSVFNCIKNSNTNGKNLQQTVDNPNAYSFVDKTGEEFTFWGNGDFLYIGKNNKSQGKWKCKGSNNFEVITDWGGTKYYYRSETGQWALTPNAPALEENFIKKIVTKHLRSKL